MTDSAGSRKLIFATIMVAALGYFVDVYDLLVFSVVRVASLKDLGVPDDALLEQGLFLLNVQMAGMLLGGVCWGVSGDRRGRLSVLLGSIFLYSIANIANGFVQSIEAYALWRFISGVGLAGELGAGITLVSECMSKESRGYGTTMVATIGVAGAVAAGIIGRMYSWRTCFFIGGGLGLALLILRVSVHESQMFRQLENNEDKIRRGDLRQLLAPRERFLRYLNCIVVGLPIWYMVGILVTLCPEFGVAFGLSEPLVPGTAILYSYGGFVVGDFLSGALSQMLRSRRKALLVFICTTFLAIVAYLYYPHQSAKHVYWVLAALGVAGGYWAVFITAAAEQFGTNLRATVATTVPNFIRGSVVPISSLFVALKAPLGIITSAAVVGTGCVVLALFSLWHLKETYGTDLDYLER